MRKTDIVFIHALSPLHAGAGSGVGTVDLPIARERATGIPIIPGSSIKGVLRDKARHAAANGNTSGASLTEEHVTAMFGAGSDEGLRHAGAIAVGDAKLLLFPVRSVAGTFGYMTSPYLLQRFARENVFAGASSPPLPKPPGGLESCLIPENTSLVADGTDGRTVYFEDLALAPTPNQELTAWETWLSQRLEAPLSGRLCLVHDDIAGFLLATATEIIPRVRIGREKTAEDKALWYEENLPAETVLYSLVSLAPSRRPGVSLDMGHFHTLLGTAQIGGNAGIGRGLCRLSVVNHDAN